MTQFERVKDSGARQKFASGAVRDIRAGKGRPDLIPPLALLRLAKHYENGAVKYGDNNWTLGIPSSKFLQSALRHLNTYLMNIQLGQSQDEDHLSAAVFNVFGLIFNEEMVERGLRPAELIDLPKLVTEKPYKAVRGNR
jgi:hypothetical protein